MVDGDLALYDSSVILDYLEDAYPDPPLFPHGTASRARCRLLAVYADEVMIVPLRALMHRTGPRPVDTTAWETAETAARRAAEAIRVQHVAIDGTLRGRSFLLDAFTAADIAVFMAVLFGQRLGGPRLDDLPDLTKWYEGLKSRPSFASVVAEIVAADATLSAPSMGAASDRASDCSPRGGLVAPAEHARRRHQVGKASCARR